MPGKGTTPRTCEACGAAFTTTPSKALSGRGRYCGLTCSNASKSGRNQYTDDPRQVAYICEHCGTTVITYRSHVRKFCSTACRRAVKHQPRWCERCGKAFTIPLSHALRAIRTGYNRGRFCNRACSLATPEAKRAQKTAATQRSRARKKGAAGYATAEQIAGRIAMWGSCCYMCGNPANTIDHVIPLMRGGTNWPANLRPACWSCNLRKGDRPLK